MGNIRLYLKANDKIFINGAVLQVDRKVAFELLNDATFLLDNHVLQKEDANTPLKQLYFVIQLMMIHPENKDETLALYRQMVKNLLNTLETEELLAGVKDADVDVQTDKVFNALRTIRGLFDLEDQIMNGATGSGQSNVTVLADERVERKVAVNEV